MKKVDRDRDEVELLRSMMVEWTRRGHPEKSLQIKRAVRDGIEVGKDLVIHSMIDPDNAKSLTGFVPPPRTGRGSGVEQWRDFAFEMTDIDEAVVDEMTREDIIALLEDEGVIGREED